VAGGCPGEPCVPPGITPARETALTFRLLERSDLPLLARWLGAPHIATWWREHCDFPAVEARYGPAIDGTDPTELLIVEIGRVPVGFAQWYLVDDDPAWRRTLPEVAPSPAVGIDYLIGPESLVGRGLGPAILIALAQSTWERHPDAASIVVDVDQGNRRSWRALEKAGFRRAWSGVLASDDPSDAGPNHVYVLVRPPLT
jgi:aminoglycoside 6'-N-acetyltransferase